MNKFILVLIVSAGTLSVSAKNNITIKSAVNNDTVYYYCYDVQDMADRVFPTDKQFVTLKKGKATIQVPDDGAILEFWGPGLFNGNSGPIVSPPGKNIIFTVKGSDKSNMRVSGSELAANILAIEALGDSLQAIIRSLPEDDKVAFDSIYTLWRKRYDNALPYHLNDDFGIYCLDKATIDTMNKYFDSIPEPHKDAFFAPVYEQNRTTIENYRERMAAKERIKVGADAPEFILPDMNDNLVSLSSFRDKWVLLDFWGSWCKWCMIGVPQMKENYAKYSDKCEFIGIDCNDLKEDWIKCVKANDMDWVQLFNKPKNGKPASIIYGVSGYPTKILINPDGRIAKICVGEDKTFYDDFSELMK
ncbi:MAG: redoxin domain-containing protein [Paramuribaculum sp.]|nr:redoxin domain-containing protein [Paramuribaculum sp.]